MLNMKQTKTRRYIKWKNVGITMVIFATIVSIIALAFANNNVDVPVDSSELEKAISIEKEKQIEKIHQDAAQEEHDKASAESKAMYEEVKKMQEEENSSASVSPSVIGQTPRILLTASEIETIVLAVQHEVGKTSSYSTNIDFDYVQQMMAACIINRIGNSKFGQTLNEVLTQKNQFPYLLEDIENWKASRNASQFDPNDERTRRNVLAVINGTSEVPDDLFYEFSSVYNPQVSVTVQYEERTTKDVFLVRPLLHMFMLSSDGRICYFAREPL